MTRPPRQRPLAKPESAPEPSGAVVPPPAPRPPLFSARNWPLAVVLAVAAYLCLVRLGNTALWDDEAQDAIFGRNFLATGELTGWDGRNLYGYRDGAILDENLISRNPPVAPMLAAASFRLLGVGTWPARLPFTLMGLAALLMLAVAYREDFPEDRAGLFYAAGAMTLSPEFLLNARQCRYYMPCLLACLVVYWGHSRFMRGWSWGALAAIAGGSILLFYSNWLVCAVFLAALATMHLLFHRRTLGMGGWVGLGYAAAAFLACTLPYAISRRIWERPDMPAGHDWGWLRQKAVLLWWTVRDLNTTNMMPWLLLLLFAFFLWRGRGSRENRAAIKWFAFGVLNMAWLTVVSPQTPETTKFADIRYLIASMPFLFGVAGWVLGRAHRFARPLAALVFAVLVTSNALSVAPGQWKFYWLLPAYAREVHRPYPTLVSEVADYLGRNARQDETVFVSPDFNTYPIMFYVGDKVRFNCVLTRKTALPKDKLRALKTPLYINDGHPDWLVLCGQAGARDLVKFFSKPYVDQGRTVTPHYRLAATLNVFWQDRSRPELLLHSFGPVQGFLPSTHGVLIFRKSPAER